MWNCPGLAGCCTVRPRDEHGRRACRGGSAGAAVQRGRADATAKDGRRRIKVTAKEKAEARDKLDEALRKIKVGTPIGSALETVADVLRSWLEHGLDRRKIKSESTVDGLTWAVEKQLIPAIGACRIRGLECDQVDDMLAGWRRRTTVHPHAGSSPVRGAAFVCSQLRRHGLIDVLVDVAGTDAVEDAIARQQLADRRL